MQKKYCFMSETGRRDTARSVKLDRPRSYPRTLRHTSTRLLQSGLMVCLLALSGCDWFSEPYAYFLFDFEAEVEGETFAFKSKVVCRKVRSYYRLRPKSFGTKLASDRGFYVSAPDLCRTNLYNQDSGHPVWAGLEKNTPLVPIMYVTRGFEDPWEIRAFIHPLGPPPGAMVRLIKATVSPLTPDEAESYEEVPSGVNDPLAYYDGDEKGRHGRKNKDWPQAGVHFIKMDPAAITPDEIERTETEGSVQYIYLKEGVEKTKKIGDQYSFLTSILRSSGPPPSIAINKIIRLGQPTTDARRKEIYEKLNRMYSVRIKDPKTCTGVVIDDPRDQGQLFFYTNSLLIERRQPPRDCPDKIIAFGKAIRKPIRMPIDFATQKIFRIGADLYYQQIFIFRK